MSEVDAPFYEVDGVAPRFYPLTEVLCGCHRKVLPLTFDCVIPVVVLFTQVYQRRMSCSRQHSGTAYDRCGSKPNAVRGKHAWLPEQSASVTTASL